MSKKKKKKAAEAEIQEESRSGNREILVITYFFILIFLGLIAYFIYFMAVQSKDVINNSYNQRQGLLAKRVVRGEILGSKGEILAQTLADEHGNEVRHYPYGKMFAHVVGHSTQGKTGVELSENFNLLTSNDNIIENIQKKISGEKVLGDKAVTTLNVELQRIAYDSLGNFRGAIIVQEPATGKILAMVSKPDYDPNPGYLNSNWENMVADAEGTSCLLNRATQGLYPPGSTFKIVTALQYIREQESYNKFRYDCNGTETQSGYTVNCYRNHVHGSLDLKTAFAKSCNSCFAFLGTRVSVEGYRESCENLLFSRKLPTTLVYNKSSFVLNEKSNKEEIMHTAMGQGKTQITPLHLSMIVSAIANKGIMMRSYVVDRLENTDGKIVRQYKQKSYGSVMTEEEATTLTKYMKEVISSGTASQLQGLSYSVAGKTGSAEYDSSKNSHAWFTGFAPAKNPKIAVTVLVEQKGTGSEYAVPIAKKIFQSYLGN